MIGTFKIGEKVVYPAHGVGVIEGVQTKVISGSERKFYMLRIIDSDMTIMIPTENVQSVGLRRIIGKDMVAKVYKILRDKKVEIDQQTWNRRYREYTEKIKTGSVLEIAKVLRDLFREEVASFWVDQEETYKEVVEFVQKLHPEWVERVKHFTSDLPIFEAFAIEKEIEAARQLPPELVMEIAGARLISGAGCCPSAAAGAWARPAASPAAQAPQPARPARRRPRGSCNP